MQEQQAVLFQPQYHSADNESCSCERLGTKRLILDVKSCGVAASVKMWCVFSSFLSEDAEDGEVCYLECEEVSGYLIFNREVGCTAFIVWLVVEAICHCTTSSWSNLSLDDLHHTDMYMYLVYAVLLVNRKSLLYNYVTYCPGPIPFLTSGWNVFYLYMCTWMYECDVLFPLSRREVDTL